MTLYDRVDLRLRAMGASRYQAAVAAGEPGGFICIAIRRIGKRRSHLYMVDRLAKILHVRAGWVVEPDGSPAAEALDPYEGLDMDYPCG